MMLKAVPNPPDEPEARVAERRRGPALGARVSAPRAAVADAARDQPARRARGGRRHERPGARRRLRRRLLVDDARRQSRDLRHRHLGARDRAGAARASTPSCPTCRASTPFAGTKFAEIIGNCSLEHVPDIDAALANLRAAAADDARLLMFVPTPRWAYQGRMQSLLLEHAPRVAMAVVGRAQRLLPALAPLRSQGVDAPARAARLARPRDLRPRLGALGVPVPRVHAAGVRRVRREEADRVLPVEARALPARRRARAAREARALGGVAIRSCRSTRRTRTST